MICFGYTLIGLHCFVLGALQGWNTTNLEKTNSVTEATGGSNHKLRIPTSDYSNIEDNTNFVLYYAALNMSLVAFELINLTNHKMLGVAGGEEKAVDPKVAILNEWPSNELKFSSGQPTGEVEVYKIVWFADFISKFFTRPPPSLTLMNSNILSHRYVIVFKVKPVCYLKRLFHFTEARLEVNRSLRTMVQPTNFDGITMFHWMKSFLTYDYWKINTKLLFL